MSHMVYEKMTHGGKTNYNLLPDGAVSLAGKKGLIFSHIREELNPESTVPIPWEMSSIDVLRGVGRPGAHAVVINIMPKCKNRVSLFELEHIYGFSYCHWSPVCLLLRELDIDHFVDDPQSYAQHFTIVNSPSRTVATFLYLKGGYKSERGIRQGWGWGPSGNVNAPLLWKDAFDYFSAKLAEGKLAGQFSFNHRRDNG